MISTTVFLLLLLGLICWLGPVSYELSKPVWYIAMTDLVWLVYPFVAFHEMKHLRKLKEKLSLGDTLSRKKDWKKDRYLHWLSAALSILLYFALLTGTFVENFVEWEDSYWQPVAEYEGDLPFPTMEDLAGGGTHNAYNWSVDHNNEVAIRSTLTAKTQMTFEQFGSITNNGETLLDGSLWIEYYDMRTEWLAKELFREIRFKDSLNIGRYIRYEDLEDPDLSVDQVDAYADHYPILLLRQGTQVLKVRMSQHNQDCYIPLDQWAATVAKIFAQ